MTDLFQSTTIPVLEQMVQFAQARHTLLAANIANIDTPGYVAKDLSVAGFQQRLREAIDQQHQASLPAPAEWTSLGQTSLADAAKDPQGRLLHDQPDMGLEQQVSEMVKNHMQHNLAISLMNKQFQLLEAVISEKA
jgi:flagellar basal-body rod protein FlgB